jgi:tRNA/tmRNA/rRNA uracil-C5-methylase (TrmA/RlmC/RlmD family)
MLEKHRLEVVISLYRNRQGDGEKVFFECLAAEEAVAQGQVEDCQVLVVDPPRKGLDRGVLQLLTNEHPEKTLSPG